LNFEFEAKVGQKHEATTEAEGWRFSSPANAASNADASEVVTKLLCQCWLNKKGGKGGPKLEAYAVLV
jgi:hypothetical protein